MSGRDFIRELSQGFRLKRSTPQFWLLVDPDKIGEGESLELTVTSAERLGVDAILVGSSIIVRSELEEVVHRLKECCSLPVVIFPGDRNQLSAAADAVLFLTMLSSRNPRWLVDEQVLAAPKVKALGLATIPVGYLLIDSGGGTAVEFFSVTPPLPRTKPDIAVAHALAAQYMGMHAVFLEAGSGADEPVPDEIVRAVAESVDIAVIVGGGIKTPQQAARKAKFADVVVVGNFFETNPQKLSLLSQFAEAVHGART